MRARRPDHARLSRCAPPLHRPQLSLLFLSSLVEFGPDASDVVFHLALAKYAQQVERSAETTERNAMAESQVAMDTPHVEPDAINHERETSKQEEDASPRPIPDWLKLVSTPLQSVAIELITFHLQGCPDAQI